MAGRCNARWARLGLVSVVVVMALHVDAVADEPSDAFGQYYVQQRRLYNELKGAPESARMEVLDGVLREADARRGSPYAASARLWGAQVYSTNGKPERAVTILRTLAESTEASPNIRAFARCELGLAYERSGRSAEAERVWQDIVSDENVGIVQRGVAAEQLRASLMRRRDWEGALKVAETELGLGVGRKAVLYETAARSARRMGKYGTASDYYRRILDEFPDYREPNRMLYIEKALITCQHGGERMTRGYIEDMEAVLGKYEPYAEAWQEHYTLGQLYVAGTKAGRPEGPALGISREDALAKAVEHFTAAIQGIKDISSNETRNIAFDAVVYGSYVTAAQALAEVGLRARAAGLLEEYLALYSSLDQDRALSVQQFLTTMLYGNLDLRDAQLEILDMVDLMGSLSEDGGLPSLSSGRGNVREENEGYHVDESLAQEPGSGDGGSTRPVTKYMGASSLWAAGGVALCVAVWVLRLLLRKRARARQS